MTKKDLEKYLILQQDIRNSKEKIEKLETEAANLKNRISDMPKGNPNKSKLEDIVCNILEVEKTLNEQINEGYKIMNQIEKAIDILNGDHKEIIRLRYLEGMRWDHISRKIRYSVRMTHIKHVEALRRLNIS